jgi:hypothetical protein
MAIFQGQAFSLQLYGDGTSTEVSLDLTKYLNSYNTLPNTPTSVLAVTTEGGGSPSVSSYSFVGSTLSVVFSSAPEANTYFLLNISLLF